MTRYVHTCLWKGKDVPHEYGVADVVRLETNMLQHIPDATLVCHVDDAHHKAVDLAIKGITVPFLGLGVGGWSNVLELFGWSHVWEPKERHLAVGLDTVFVGNCDWLFEWSADPVGLPLDPYAAPVPCDAVISFSMRGSIATWGEFLESRQSGMKGDLYANKPSEMALLRRMYAENGWRPLEKKPHRLLSYKKHVRDERRSIDGASIVYFHGKPKPTDLPKDDPVFKAWKGLPL